MSASTRRSCSSRPWTCRPATCSRCTWIAGQWNTPWVARQLLGVHRQFVFGQEARQRWPELALFAATVLAYVAATTEGVATGFWDRAPQRTAGRVRRVLAQVVFPADFPLLRDIRKEASRTDHLRKGVNAHRRVQSLP